MKVIALYSMKGGVGKTASAVNISYLAARDGRRSLLVDLDPQGSSSFYFRVRPGGGHGTKTLLKGGKKISKNIRETDFENLDILPADMSYRNLDLILDGTEKREKVLQKNLSAFKKEYDYIFLDCPPNITLVSENIFHAADIILVPFIPTTLSWLTYDKLLAFFREIEMKRRKLFPFFSMVERRKKLHREMIEILPAEKKRFLKSMIPYSSDVERMGLERAPLPATHPASPATRAFENLWREVKEID
ncbi:MAG TPA: ParA family protein [Caldithrix abyssi]|uniref:ParA family protein n=1 Tax=Caldithrix abyssi TaxID=187145 RepID=A0A7V5RQF3_CALAY|nr:ParA family protein [Caldithrix abyssi]